MFHELFTNLLETVYVQCKGNSMKELPTPTLDLSPIALPRGSLHCPPEQNQKSVVSSEHSRPSIQVAWAQNISEVREAQKLRHLVFATEMGAQLNTSVPGHDIDLFDDFCEHLLVRDVATQQVVGT